MATRAEWLALAERAENGEGRDRDLQQDLIRALRGTGRHIGYTTSIDAAALVVPAGWLWWREPCGDMVCGEAKGSKWHHACHHDPARALLAAACRAQAEEAGDAE